VLDVDILRIVLKDLGDGREVCSSGLKYNKANSSPPFKHSAGYQNSFMLLGRLPVKQIEAILNGRYARVSLWLLLIWDYGELTSFTFN
jgi:hypothetical protein